MEGCTVFEYNKKFWENMFEPDDEDVKPNKTWYMPGILIGLAAGTLAGILLGYIVPLAALGGALGMWIGNHFER